MTDCIFCKIADGEMNADIVFQNDEVVAFNDLFPKYPTHVVIIPKKHIVSAAELKNEDDMLVGKILRIGAKIAKEKGLTENGFRLLTNTGGDAGQSVQHLHVHLLGGEKLRPI